MLVIGDTLSLSAAVLSEKMSSKYPTLAFWHTSLNKGEWTFLTDHGTVQIIQWSLYLINNVEIVLCPLCKMQDNIH